MDKLLERCEKHRQATRGRKSKRTRSPRRNIVKSKQDTLATSQAPRTPTQTTNQAKKVPQDATSRHASTSKQTKKTSQAQIELTHSPRDENISWFQKENTAPEPRMMKPDGTPKDPNDNPVIKHSTLTPDNSAISTAHTDRYAHGTTTNSKPGTVPTPGALTKAPDTRKIESKTGEGEKGLTALPAFSPQDRHPNANKLTRKAKTDVLALLAMGYTSKTVLIWLVQHYGIQVSRRNIDFMRNSQRKRIDQARQDISKKILESVPVASKLQRLTIRDELVDDLRRKLWRRTGRKIVNGKMYHEYKGSHETINKLLDSVKAEVEPLEINVSVNLRSKTAQQYADIPDGGVISEAMDKLKAAGMEVAQVVAPTEPDK